MNTLIHACIAATIISFAHAILAAPIAQVEVEVITPDQHPVVGARVGIGGGLGTPSGITSRTANGMTDGNGRFSATIVSASGNVTAFAEAIGFYSTERAAVKLFESEQEINAAHESGHWPSGGQPLQLILKQIKNPVPMYAKKINLLIPEVESPVYYDLLKGDWVSPRGTGIVPDLEFTVEATYYSPQNYEGRLTLRLPGPANGIMPYDCDQFQRSALRMPYEAPVSGFLEKWVWENTRRTPPYRHARSKFVDESMPHRGFVFRVRASVDVSGNIIRACYGKIHGPVFFQTFENGKSRVGFAYYLNPTGDRNLEFDPRHNLLTNLETNEQVYQP